MNQATTQTLWPPPAFRWLIWLVVVGAWTALLLMPIRIRPGAVGGVGDTFLLAKLMHFLGYAFLTALSGWLHVRPGRRRWLLLFLVLHAAAGEYLQTFVGRTGSPFDVAIDALGISAGLFASWEWWRP